MALADPLGQTYPGAHTSVQLDVVRWLVLPNRPIAHGEHAPAPAEEYCPGAQLYCDGVGDDVVPAGQ